MTDVEYVQGWKTRETQGKDETSQFYGEALDRIMKTVDFFKIYVQPLHSAVKRVSRLNNISIQLLHFQADGATCVWGLFDVGTWNVFGRKLFRFSFLI